MNKVQTTTYKTTSETFSIQLSTGGFVEVQLAEPGRGYLKIHLGEAPDYGDTTNAWRYIHHSKNKDTLKLLCELRNATNSLIETLEAK